MKICGLDEAGRGALAGPMSVVAVVFDMDYNFENIPKNIIIRDSKKLTNIQRNKLYDYIVKNAIQIETEIMTVDEINLNGVGWANTEGFSRLINRIDADKYIVDGRWYIPNIENKISKVEFILGADEFIPCALAAGVVAKMKRDEVIMELIKEYPYYGWETNTGHGTKKHMESILEYGTCEYHRTTFVKTALRNLKKHERTIDLFGKD